MNIHELLYIGVCLLVSATGESPYPTMNCDDMTKWLKEVNVKLGIADRERYEAYWNYLANPIKANADLKSKTEISRSTYIQETSLIAKAQNIKCDSNTDRQLKIIKLLDTSPHDTALNEKLVEIKTNMVRVFSTAKTTHITTKKDLTLGDLLNIFSTSGDLQEIQWAWEEWSKLLGRPLRKLFPEYIKLSNTGATNNGFDDYGDSWRKINYMTPNIDKVADQLYSELKPMYEQLFTYVRHKLIEYYKNEKTIDIQESGPVPAHLFGNILAFDWTSLMKKQIVTPFPDVPITDVTNELIKNNYTVVNLLDMAENFFTSIGLSSMTRDFWKNSLFVKLDDKSNRLCHVTAWDFGGTDFRIMMCAKATQSWLVRIHHEMGHIEYYMAFKDQPAVYRDGANAAFQEAIGEAIALSVSSNKYLKKMNLTNDTDMTEDQRQHRDMNDLMQQALLDISSLPFSYIVDKMRWGMFAGQITPENYNQKWWELRLKYQGVVPPVQRSEADFDFGGLFHVAHDYSYLRYFLAGIIRYQFYKAMCDAAGHKGLLHLCDFSGSKTAGNKLKEMLAMGKSQPWPDAMEVMTGQRNISTAALIEYYKPLTDWLKEENKGKSTTWIPSGESVKSIIKKHFDFESAIVKANPK